MTASHALVSFRAYIDDVALQWTGKRAVSAQRIVHAARDLNEKLGGPPAVPAPHMSSTAGVTAHIALVDSRVDMAQSFRLSPVGMRMRSPCERKGRRPKKGHSFGRLRWPTCNSRATLSASQSLSSSGKGILKLASHRTLGSITWFANVKDKESTNDGGSEYESKVCYTVAMDDLMGPRMWAMGFLRVARNFEVQLLVVLGLGVVVWFRWRQVSLQIFAE